MKGIKNNLFRRVLTIIAVISMSFSSAFLINAELDNTVKKLGIELSKSNFKLLPFKTSTVLENGNHDGIEISDVTTVNELAGNSLYEMDPTKTYKAVYPAALNYHGKMLTVEVTGKLQKPLDEGEAKVYISGELFRIGWIGVHGAKVDWTIKFIDPDTNEPYRVHVLFAIQDPDESHILYKNADDYTLFYNDAGSSDTTVVTGTASENFVVENDGIYRLEPGTEQPIDTSTYQEDPKGFDVATFYIELKDKSYFEFTTDTVYGGSLVVPEFYSLIYEIAYNPNKETIKSTVSGTMNNQVAKTGDNTLTENAYKAAGYEFLGWSTKSGEQAIDYSDKGTLSLNDADFGDEVVVRTLYAQWKPIEYKLEYNKNHENATGTMDNQKATVGDNELHENGFNLEGYTFEGWSTKEGENPVEYQPTDENVTVTETDVQDKKAGETVKVLYAQWKPLDYKIKYDANGGEGTMTDNDYTGADQTMPSAEEWTFTREGYTLSGFKLENEGDLLNGSVDYRKTLLADDDRTVTLFAQWEPWKYYVNYDANGGVGDMPTQTFLYTDDSMVSKPNAFTRDGYEFIGFEYTYKNTKYIITSVQEFHDMLKGLGPNSEITLIAQWKKLPDPVVKYYSLPVTGVE